MTGSGLVVDYDGKVWFSDWRGNWTFSLLSQHWRQMRNGEGDLQMAKAAASFQMRKKRVTGRHDAGGKATGRDPSEG